MFTAPAVTPGVVSPVASILCPEETVEGVSFPRTGAGEVAVVACPAYQTGSHARRCGADGQWEAPENTCRGSVGRLRARHHQLSAAGGDAALRHLRAAAARLR